VHSLPEAIPAHFPPGTLWDTLREVTQRALQSGALQPIPTDFQYLEDGGIRFLVRLVRNLARKPRPSSPETPSRVVRRNPFLPFDPELYVADASPGHVCLLNKFNVVEHHLLIVTRAFEEQETLLTREDFEALWKCLAEYEGLGFYNSGIVSGASQPHKHLQLVPLPLDPAGPALPIAPTIDSAGISADVRSLDGLPFPHAVVALDADAAAEPATAAAQAYDRYRRLLPAIGVALPAAVADRVAKPYNLLATRRWMLAVPRVRECFHSISCNSLTFAGALLVRDEQELETLQRHGPLAALRHVTSEEQEKEARLS